MACTWSPATIMRACEVGASRARRAFSLLEIMLVLVVVGIVAALAVPAMNAAFATYEARQAADRVRARMVEARRRAVERGIPYAFLYVNGGAEHGFAACQSLADVLTIPGASTTLSDAVARNPYDVNLFALEEGFRIVSGGLAASGTEQAQPSGDMLILLLTPDERLAASAGTPFLSIAIQQSGLNQRGPVSGFVWYPDGTTQPHELTVVSPSGFAVGMRVEGETGAIQVLPVTRAQDQGAPTSPPPRLPQFDRRIQ